MKNKNSKENILINVWLISIILIGLSTSVIGAANSYQLTLTRGTQTLTVSTYDKDTWESYVGKSETPKTWFGGEANEKSSLSRITIRSTDDVKYETYDLWTLIFMVEMSKEALGVLKSNTSQFDFTQEDVNDKYSDTYEAWEVLYAKWKFTSATFEEEADNANKYMWIFFTY